MVEYNTVPEITQRASTIKIQIQEYLPGQFSVDKQSRRREISHQRRNFCNCGEGCPYDSLESNVNMKRDLEFESQT